MRRYQLIPLSIFLVIATSLLSSCEAIGGIFKAGIWTGVIIIVAVIALILYLVGRSRK